MSETALIQAIRANLHDDLPRLVYADWLEERGDPRHRFLRLECELVRTWGYAKPRHDLFTRLAVLRAQFDPAWLAQVQRCTTPAPPVDVTEIHPALKPLARTTVRLHPRPGDAPLDASKIGGKFLWPAKEEWPQCAEHDCPFVGALQLRKDDVPEVGFKRGTDLFQLLWCPQRHVSLVEARAYWRKQSAIHQPADAPALPDGNSHHVPTPCQLHPERVVEYPGLSDLTAELRGHLAAWAVAYRSGDMYRSWLSVCGGTKVGGHTAWVQNPTPVNCSCGEPMELLVQFGSLEFAGRGWERWLPIQDRVAQMAAPQSRWVERNPAHASFGDTGRVYVFNCRHCKARPFHAFTQG